MHPTLQPKAAALLATSALLALVAGCGSSSDGAGSDASSGSSSVTSSAGASDTGASGTPADTEATSAAWLAGQLKGGVLHDPAYNFDDYGKSADVALALAAAGGQDATVKTVAATVKKHQQAYVAPGYGTLTSAGAVAKTIVLDQTAGTDPGALVKTLEGLVTPSGRVADKLDPKSKKAADYANTIVQALTVEALGGAGSAKAAPALKYLLAQQCSGGFFRLYFPTDGKGAQTCDADPKSAGDVDTTAYAVLALSKVSERPGVSDALVKAVDWLVKSQGADGSFKASKPPVPNADSTGLAAWALGVEGKTEEAGKGATWIAAHTVTCGKDAGAIAYDDTALKGAGTQGVTPKTAGQFWLATAQALPALQWLPAGAAPQATC